MLDVSLSDGVCVLRLNAPPLNALTFSMLEALVAGVRAANADDAARAIVIAGGPKFFSAGADVNIFKEIETAEEAIRTSRVFQEALGKIEDSAKPVAAAVAGSMVGGALELAMACHCRVSEKGAKFSMPEINLGINSGAGGTQRLPRLVGAEKALKMLLTGRPVGAREALEMGLVDALCDGDRLVEKTSGLVKSLERPVRTRFLTDKVSDEKALQALFTGTEKSLEKGRPEIIAPWKILDAVRTGLTESVEAGYRKEQTGFAECMETLATRNKIYLFFATRGLGGAEALKETKPRRIAKTAVVGMGSMGAGIAHAFIIAGKPVTVLDESDGAVKKGTARTRKSVEGRVAQGKLAPERAEAMLGLLAPASGWDDLAESGLVLEAVFEDLEVKRSVLARLEEVCPPETILATNTSTLSIDDLAEGMDRPERLVGLHFFNPAHRMPLVEVVRGEATSDEAVATALSFVKDIRKTPVLVKDYAGFLVNRLFIPYLKEAFHLLEEGAEPEAIDAAMTRFGFPMGPLTLLDMAGVEILAMTDEILLRAFPFHGPLSRIVPFLVERGHLGQKSGSGVYKYEKGDYTRYGNDALAEIAAEARQESGVAAREIDGGEIEERLVLRMVAEAFHVLDEGIAQSERDIYAATVLGVRFPDFRGGVLKYARDIGLDAISERLEKMSERQGERFTPIMGMGEAVWVKSPGRDD